MGDASPSSSGADVPPFVEKFVEKFVDKFDASQAGLSALCISKGLTAPNAAHMSVNEAAALEQRQMYLEYLSNDRLDALVDELTLSIQSMLGGAPLNRVSNQLSVRIDEGPWVHSLRAGACLTLGRHPRSGLVV